MDDGLRPWSGGDDELAAPPPPAMRAWRHPSELGNPPPPPAPPPLPLHRGIVAGTAVITLLVVVGVSRVLVPGTLDQATAPASVARVAVTVGAPELPPSTSSVAATVPATTVAGPVATTTPLATSVTTTSVARSSPTPAPTTSLPPTGSVGATPTARDGVFAVAIQDGALYVTTRGAVGDAHSISLSVDGRELVGRVLAIDEEIGIAVLHVASSNIDPSAIGRMASASPALEAGDAVRFVSSSEGSLGEVKAIVGATDDHTLELQVDGDPVGEGVPVFDVEGRLVGLTADGGRRLILIESLRHALDATVDASLGRSNGTSSIGIEGLDVSTRADCAGVRVLEVMPGSPSAKAGVRIDDIIVGFDGTSTTPHVVHSAADLALDIDDHSPGDQVALVVERAGLSITLSLTLD